MYLGRFLIVGPDVAAYRVSSRSFPNRQIVNRDGTLTVQPTPAADPTDNPYVEYNCLRETPDGTTLVLGNGSHVDPIVEKCAMGYPPRDALASALLALDYEKDDYNTPRIAGVLQTDGTAMIAIVRDDALLVEPATEPTLVATYQKDRPEAISFEPEDAVAAAQDAYDLSFEHAVCAAGAVRHGDEFLTAIENGS